MSCDHKENLLLELALYRWSHCLLLAACRHDLPINGKFLECSGGGEV